MTTLTLDLTPEVYERLRLEAERKDQPIKHAAQEMLAEHLALLPTPRSEREQAQVALRAAGLLTELGAQEKQRAEQATMTLAEVRAALDRAGGPPLSELVMEMRGSSA